MPTALKRKKYKVKKLQGGGTPEGDPIPTQAYGGFQLYLETLPDGTKRITPTPTSGNYVKISDKGFYPGIPLSMPAAEVVADDPNKGFMDLSSIDEVVNRTGAGVLGDYAKVPESEREAVEQAVRDATGKFAGTAAAVTGGAILDALSWPQRYLVNPQIALATGEKVNLNPLGYTQSFLEGLGYGDDPGEGFMTPSEGLGVKNPWLGIPLDIATDPLTYLGAGLARQSVQKGGPALLRNVSKPRINISSLKGSYNIPKSTIAENIGGKTHEIFGKFLSKHHPDVIESIQKGTLSIDDVMSDPKLVEDFINRHQYSYRGFTANPNVPGQVDEFASTYRYPRPRDIDRNLHGAGVYSYAGDRGAQAALDSYTGILSRNPTLRNIQMESGIIPYYEKLGEQPFLARLKTDLPKFNPDDIPGFWSDYGKFQQYGKKIPPGTLYSGYQDIPHLWKGQRSGQLFSPSQAQDIGFSLDELNKSLLSRIGEYGQRGHFNPDLYRYGQEALGVPGFRYPSWGGAGGDHITTVARPGSGIQSIDEIIPVGGFDPTVDEKVKIIESIIKPSLRKGGKVKAKKSGKYKLLKK